MKGSGRDTQIKPHVAQIETIVNQGRHAQVANVTSQILDKVTQKLNNQISEKNVTALEQQHIDIPSVQYGAFKSPVDVKTTTLNQVKDHQANGNAAAVMFTPIWFASIVTAVMAYIAFKNQNNVLRQGDKWKHILKTLIVMAFSAFIGVFIYVYYMGSVLGFDFTQPVVTATYVSIALFAFSLLILAFMVWIGFAAIPIFIIFMFFTIQVVMLPKVMVPEFYQKYILPWNPIYYYMDGLKGILYEGRSLMLDGTISMFISFMIIGILSLSLAMFFKKAKQ